MYDIEYVRNFIKDNNCTLLSEEYKNEIEKILKQVNLVPSSE